MKVKGVTLPEMLFVLILTGLIVGFCGYSFLIIKQHELNYQSRNKEVSNTVLMVTRITSLAYQANIIYLRDSKVIFANRDPIGQLALTEDSIVLENAGGLVFSKVGYYSLNLDTVQLKNDVCLVKSFSFVPEGLRCPIVFRKEYKGALLLNNSINWKE